MKQTITLFFIFFFGGIKAQNLVLNPSFENYQDCPASLGEFHGNVSHWTCSNYGSTDYYNNCSKEMGYTNYVGQQNPRTGTAYAGIYTFGLRSYREYIQTKLSSKLIKDTEYLITFYVSLSDFSSHSINRFGTLFTSEMLDNKSAKFIHFKYLERDHILYSYVTSKDDNFYNNTQLWTQISIKYIAKGFEKFISIGNYDTNREIELHEVSTDAERQFSYYYIDDISVVPYHLITTKQHDKETFIENKTYVFRNVLFDFDKSELLKNSIIELDELYDYLSENQNFNIEIYGHTDNVGLVKRNEELSLQRAKSVANYLIKNGLSQDRITWFGFGSLQPKVTNNTEEGRATNRRVEFKLLKL